MHRSLCATLVVVGLSAGLGSEAPLAQSSSVSGTRAPLERISHDENILPDETNAGFGALLYDARGELAIHDGHKTWLYTTSLFEDATGGKRNWYGKWVTDVREFDVESHSVGSKRVALGVEHGERWAVVHDVVQVGVDLFVAFYSANGSVRAALSRSAQGPFAPDPTFALTVTDAWERRGGKVNSLESNGAHVLISDTDSMVSLWLGYDSYYVDATAGRLGWANIEIDKRRRTVRLLGKRPGNPLRVAPEGYIAARCGGNLSTSLRLEGRHALFYYSRPDTRQIMLTIALSRDPLFQHVERVIEFEPPLGDEQVIEKFETYSMGGELHLIYENKLANGQWGTAVRVYRIVQ